MDSYFPKTRRPVAGLSSSLKRPPPSITPPRAAKIPATPTTPKDARITRPKHPPPVRRKLSASARGEERRRPISVRELFKTVHLLEESPRNETEVPLERLPVRPLSIPTTPTKTTSKSTAPETTENEKDLLDPANHRISTAQAHSPPITKPIASSASPSKIVDGPLRGVSTSLLDLIRAKEAAAKITSPEQERRRELLGIAPEIVRIVPTVFTANRKEIMLYENVVDKCFKGLKSNYTTTTIIECIELVNKIVPDWITIVTISRGKFMRINRDRYTIPQLLEAIRIYKRNC